jgi:hypothetical protein
MRKQDLKTNKENPEKKKKQKVLNTKQNTLKSILILNLERKGIDMFVTIGRIERREIGAI